MHKIDYLDIEPNDKYEQTISIVLKKCFEIENLPNENLGIGIILTNPINIRNLNKKYRNIDKATDVLSFPMLEKEELDKIRNQETYEYNDILGDMVISIEQVELQAKEFGHSFERELSYMVVHSFYHLLGYDHMEENDKELMRAKEENILNLLDIKRDK